MSAASPARVAATLAAGLAGGLAFHLAGLPAPWLSGAMVAVAVPVTFGWRPVLPDALRDAGMLLAGLAMGSAITPEMLRSLERYPLSLARLAVSMVAIGFAGQALLVRGFGWDRREALLASLPGALSAVLATASAAGLNLTRIASVQTFRLFVLVALLPSLVTQAVAVTGSGPLRFMTPAGFAIVAFSGFAVALLLSRLRVLAPWLFGGMIAAAATHATDAIGGAPPVFVNDLAMFLIGVFAGTRFAGVDRAALKALALPALLLFVVTVAIAMAGAALAVALGGIPVPEALVAFAPGGLEAMVVLGMALGLDPLYVSSHHVGRFVLIAFLLPFLARQGPG